MTTSRSCCIPCDHRTLGNHPFHIVGEKYIAAVHDGTDALAFLLPVLEPPFDPDDVLFKADGLLLTGSPSNIAPHRYGGAPAREGVLLDERRDAVDARSHRPRARARGADACLCRGFQELNVALGGTLYQHVNEVPGKIDHREDNTAAARRAIRPRARPCRSMPSGMLAALTGFAAIEVNSLHGQGIDRLADRLVPEAIAPDGLIEAARVKRRKNLRLRRPMASRMEDAARAWSRAPSSAPSARP